MPRPCPRLSLLLFSALAILSLTQFAISQADWSVTKTLHIGGQGGWDYITVDPHTKLLYVTRTSHTMVIDSQTGNVVGDIPGQKRSHGVALVPAVGRGFITDGGNGVIVIFDLKTNQVLGTVPALPDADGIIYDKATNRVLAVSGDEGALMIFDPKVDPRDGKLEARVDLGGAPEFLTADGKGKAYVNLENKDTVAVVDLSTQKVIAQWPVSPGGHPVGMSMDKKKRLLFIGCRNPQRLIVMSADSGKIIAALAIGAGVDATKFDGRHVFASCRDGKLEVVSEISPGKYELVQTVATPEGARTMTVDSSADTLYLPTAEFGPTKSGSRPIPESGTFRIVVVRRKR